MPGFSAVWVFELLYSGKSIFKCSDECDAYIEMTLYVMVL